MAYTQTLEQASEVLRAGLRTLEVDGARVLLIVPDGTRTAPVPWFFREIHSSLHDRVESLDVMVALGTHQPMGATALAAHLGVPAVSRDRSAGSVRVLDHVWDDPAGLAELGTIPREAIRRISRQRLDEELVVSISRAALEYDRLLILSPVFPHELVGISGGYKYLFPGISGPQIIDLTHWLAALTGNLASIGRLSTPAREVIHAAAQLVPVPASAVCTVITKRGIDGVYVGDVLEAWNAAARHSQAVHIERKPHPFRSVLACAPRMYDDLWTGGKAVYKCEPVVEPGGELIVYAPHITSPSVTHAEHILRCGYHCIDYFVDRLDELAGVPRMILGVASYVYGSGTWIDGVESPRMRVKLATGVSPDMCRRLGVEYVDPDTIDPAAWRDREDEGMLYVEKAGETLYRLEGDV